MRAPSRASETVSVPMWHCRCTPSRPRDVAEPRRSKRTTSLGCVRVGGEPRRRRSRPRRRARARARPSSRGSRSVVGHRCIVAADALGSPDGLDARDARSGAPRVRAISGRLDGTPVTSAMVFVAVGLLVGPEALGLLELSSHGEPVKLLAEATLTVVLFADASRIDLRALRRRSLSPRGCSGSGSP